MNKRALMKAIYGDKYAENSNYEPPNETLERIFATLNPQEIFVLTCRFTDPYMTLEDVGKSCPRFSGRIGVTRERVRQIEAKALHRLRHSSRSTILWPKEMRGL